MTFADKFLKIISYYSDSEDPLHDTEFIMDWDNLTVEEQETYIKSLLAGVGVLSVTVAGLMAMPLLITYIHDNKRSLAKLSVSEVMEKVVGKIKRSQEVADELDDDDKEKLFKEVLEFYDVDSDDPEGTKILLPIKRGIFGKLKLDELDNNRKIIEYLKSKKK